MKDQTARGELLQEKMRAALGAAGERLQAGAETAFRDAAADARVERFGRRGTEPFEPFEPFEPLEFFQIGNFP